MLFFFTPFPPVLVHSNCCWRGLEQSKGSDTGNDSDNLAAHGDDVSGTLEGGSRCGGGGG